MRKRRSVWPIGRLPFSILTVGLCLVPGPLLFAGPTHENSGAPLNVRPENEERVAKACDVERARRREMEDVAQKAANQKWAKSFPATVRETHMAALLFERLGDQLLIAGEPAGADLKARAVYLEQLVEQAVKDARRIPGISSEISRDRKTATAKAEAREARIPAIVALTTRDRWEEAEQNLYEQYDEISSMALWYYASDQLKMLLPFRSIREEIDEEMARRRTEAAQQTMETEIKSRLPDLDGLVAQVNAAADAVRGGGMADFGGELLPGPQLFQRFGEEWKQTAVTLMQCRALNAARAGAPEGESLPTADNLPDRSAEFSDQMALALAALVEADAEQASESQAREHYVAYLPAVGLVNTLSQEGKLAEAAAPALQKLAEKSSVLAAEVEAYRAATDDLLRWRRRIVQAYADRAAEGFPAAGEQLAEASKGVDAMSAAIPARSRSAAATGIAEDPVWAMVEGVSPNLLDQPVQAGPLIGLPTGAKITVSQLAERTLVQCAVAGHLDAELALLKAELLLEGTSPPLTLAAATAVATAERGDLVALGGKTEQVAVDAVISRYRDLSGVLWPLALGDFEQDDAIKKRPLRQILFRFTVRPVWLQHEYLFARLEEESATEESAEEEPVEEEPTEE